MDPSRRNVLTGAAAAAAAATLTASPAAAAPGASRSRILIRNGYVIDTEPQPTTRAGTDVLIEGGRITAVGRNLRAAGAQVVDATDRIVLPGFVDTHRHVWQSVLRSAAVDVDLGAYLGLLAQYGPRFRPQDVHVATLAGALECLDSGITTQLDYSHIAYSPDHADAAVDALQTAGLRAVYGYGTPITDPDGGTLADVRRIRRRLADDDALVTMAYAPLGPSFNAIPTVAVDWRIADELDLPLTIHIASTPANAKPVIALRDAGLLRRRILYVHGNSIGDDELRLIADSGATASVTPAAEAMLGSGAPATARLRRAGVVTGLGVDAVPSAPGDMFSTMRAALLAGEIDGNPRLTVEDVLRMATLDGAAALGLADRVGSLRPGKQADVILLNLDDVNMLTAERDPIAAVVTAANPHNVDTVLVAGRVVKAGGRLVHADLRRIGTALRATAARVTGQ